MRMRLAIAISGILLGATTTAAADFHLEWTVDVGSIRVVRLNPMIIGGGVSSDRIVFDVTRTSDDATGTLSLSCAASEYTLWTAETQRVSEPRPISDWPLAAELAASYCAIVDDLPQANTLTPLDIKFE